MSDEIPICRICFEEETINNIFISPCSCSGSSKHVHKPCLNTWRNLNRDSEAWEKCMECHTKYVLRYRYPLENEELFSKTNGMLICVSLQYVSACFWGGMIYFTESSVSNYLVVSMLNFNKELEKPNLLNFIEEDYSLVPMIFYFSYAVFIQTNLLLLYYLFKIIKNIKRCSLYFQKMKYILTCVLINNFQFIIYYYLFVWNDLSAFYINLISFISIFTPLTYYRLIKTHNKLIIKMNKENPEEILSFQRNPLLCSEYRNEYLSILISRPHPLRMLQFNRRNIIYPTLSEKSLRLSP
jgi:hypothetical protein